VSNQKIPREYEPTNKYDYYQKYDKQRQDSFKQDYKQNEQTHDISSMMNISQVYSGKNISE
jgi:hypothetical protein